MAMNEYIFKDISPQDIATTLGIASADVEVATDSDGTITVKTPALNSTQEQALKDLMTGTSKVEDTK